MIATRGWGVRGEKRSCVTVAVTYPVAIVPAIIGKSSVSKYSYCFFIHLLPVLSQCRLCESNFSLPVK
jgi:hypothetical protein